MADFFSCFINHIRNILRFLGIGPFLLKFNRWIIRKYYYECFWKINTKQKYLYLTFDDGPTSNVTSFVLQELMKYNAKATFFCIGEKVESNKSVYEQIISDGHSVGNHTYTHLNGFEVNNDIYLEDINKAKMVINSNLFRPPFGNIRKSQLKLLKLETQRLLPIMWSICSQDFALNISAEECSSTIIKKARKGSIILFHDLNFTLDKLRIVLPKILLHFKERGFQFKRIELRE